MEAFKKVSDPQNVVMRPLNGGIVRNKPPQNLDVRECVDAKNYIITERGPKRRPGYEPYGSIDLGSNTFTVADYIHIDLFNFWTSEVGSLEQELLLITAGPLYKVGIAGFEEVPWIYDTGTITVSGVNVTGIGTNFVTGGVYPNYLVRCGGGEARVSEVTDATNIVLEAGGTISDCVSQPYNIQHSFNDDPEYLTDYVVHNSEVIFTDFNSPLVVYKPTEAAGSQLDWYIDSNDYRIDSGNGPEDFVARCVAVFQDRLFVGHTIEATDGLRRQRIRWSTATNPRDFSESTAYIDLPYTQGGIVRLVPLGNTLVVYFDDAIFMGIPTNNPNLPVAFQKVQTNNIGLVGMKAIASFLEGHFYVGQDDIYLMTTSGPERIGSPVVEDTVRTSKHKERIYVTVDPLHNRVLFGFTKARTVMEELWSFEYKSKGWSYTTFETYMLAYPLSSFSITWDSLIGFTWSSGSPIGSTYLSWDAMKSNPGSMRLFIEYDYGLRQLSDKSGVDQIVVDDVITDQAIEAVYETGDFDFNQPDDVKTFLRLSMKVSFDVEPVETVQFSVQGSWNRGRSWRSLGTLKIKENYDEGYVNFLMTSSHVRFRITTTAEIAPFTIEEIVVKARLRGSELSLGGQTP